LVPVESTRVYVCSRWREKIKRKTLRKNRLHFEKRRIFKNFQKRTNIDLKNEKREKKIIKGNTNCA
jgi:hypothetical protein